MIKIFKIEENKRRIIKKNSLKEKNKMHYLFFLIENMI